MKSVATELNTEFLKEANFLTHLVEIKLSTTVYYTDLDIDIPYGGNTYLSRGLKFDGAEYSLSPQIDKISFEIDNVQLEFSSLVLNEEVRGKECIISIAALSDPAQIISATTVFHGIIDSCSVDQQRARFEIYNPLILWQKKTPRRVHQPTCPWVFKGISCGYAGEETWCDRTFDRCTTLVNTDNFGGFRWLPDLQDKQIWWGKTPG